MKTEQAVAKYAEMMVKTIEGLKEGWRKAWITGSGCFAPVNADGKRYNGINVFLLMLLQGDRGWELPVYVTFNRCKQLGGHVLKGEKATPVFFWKLMTKTDAGEYVEADANTKTKVFPVLRSYDVFNVAQTSLADDAPEKVKKWRTLYPIAEPVAEGEMYEDERMDRMIDGGWLCPIRQTEQGVACYSSTTDIITVPKKTLFQGADAGMEFYAAALHEMAHSTGHEKRLNRSLRNKFGSDEYGREELVAELTAAVIGQGLGFSLGVQRNNAAYLSGWLKSIRKEPRFLMSVLSDVNKAVEMINGVLN